MNETLKTIAALHTTHGNFTDREVCKDNLQTILSHCVAAANASNRQSYSIIVIEGTEKVASVLSAGCTAPLALLFCVDYNRIRDVGSHLGYKNGDESLFSYLTAHTDAVIAAQTAVIAAASMGISSLITNSIHHAGRKNLDELYTQLKLPSEHIFPVTAVLFGYESSPPTYKAGRLLNPGVVHYGEYRQLSSEELASVVETVNDPNNHFGNKGNFANYLEAYYSRATATSAPESISKIDTPLLNKLKISFLRD